MAPRLAPQVRALALALVGGLAVLHRAHAHHGVRLLRGDGQGGIDPRVHHQRLVVGELEEEGGALDHRPVLAGEHVGHLAVGAVERHLVRLALPLGGAPLQELLLVVAAHDGRVAAPREGDDPARIRPLGHQIAHEHDVVALPVARLVEQLFQLLGTPVDVANDERTAARHLAPRRYSSTLARLGMTTRPVSLTWKPRRRSRFLS